MQSNVCWAYFTLDGPHLTLVTAPTEEFQQDTPYTCVDHIHPDMLPVGQGNSSVLECHWCTVLVIWLPSSICILIPSLQAGLAGGLPLVVLVLAHPQFRQTVSYFVMFGPLYRPKAQISTKESRLKTFLKCDICILSAVLAIVSTNFYKGIKVEDISDM